MLGHEQIVKERIKQRAYYPDDTHYKKGELWLVMQFLLRDDDDADRDDYADQLIKQGFTKETLDKWSKRSYVERMKMVGAFAAAEIDREEEND